MHKRRGGYCYERNLLFAAVSASGSPSGASAPACG
ncbi:arylamine N-acetyltransferase [Streptomyces sp. NPDC016845]